MNSQEDMVLPIMEKDQWGVSRVLKAQDHKEAQESPQELRVLSVALAPRMIPGSPRHQVLTGAMILQRMAGTGHAWYVSSRRCQVSGVMSAVELLTTDIRAMRGNAQDVAVGCAITVGQDIQARFA